MQRHQEPMRLATLLPIRHSLWQPNPRQHLAWMNMTGATVGTTPYGYGTCKLSAASASQSYAPSHQFGTGCILTTREHIVQLNGGMSQRGDRLEPIVGPVLDGILTREGDVALTLQLPAKARWNYAHLQALSPLAEELPRYRERLATPRYHRTRFPSTRTLLPYTYVQTPVETSAHPCATCGPRSHSANPQTCGCSAQRVVSEELIRRMPQPSEPRSPRTCLGGAWRSSRELSRRAVT